MTHLQPMTTYALVLFLVRTNIFFILLWRYELISKKRKMQPDSYMGMCFPNLLFLICIEGIWGRNICEYTKMILYACDYPLKVKQTVVYLFGIYFLSEVI